MSLFRKPSDRDAPRGGDALGLDDATVAVLRPASAKHLKGASGWAVAPDVDGFVVAGDRYVQLSDAMLKGDALAARLATWGREARDATALLLLRRVVTTDGISLTLTLDYLPLLRGALAASGRLDIEELSQRVRGLDDVAIRRTLERIGLGVAINREPAQESERAASKGPAAPAAGHADIARRSADRNAPEAMRASLVARDDAHRAALDRRAANVLDDVAGGGRAIRIPRVDFDPRAKQSDRAPRRSSSAPASILAVLTDFNAINGQYGSRAGKRLVEAARAYCDRCAKLYPDARVELVDLGARPDLRKRPDRIKEHLDALLARDRGGETLPDVVQIIGGHSVVPHWAFRNPAYAIGDPDEFVLTDNPYADDDAAAGLEGALLPERVIARFPGENGNDASLLIAQLEAAAEGAPALARPADTKDLLGVVAAAFRTGDAVFESMAGRLDGLHISPPFERGFWDMDALQRAKYLFFLVHGSDVHPEWFGDDSRGGYPVVLDPGALSGLRLSPGATVMTEACFGAYAPGKTADEAISLAFLRAGAARVLGSLNTAWTILSEDLFKAVIAGLNANAGLAESLWRARLELTRKYPEMTPLVQKTLANFHVYGDASGVLSGFSERAGTWRDDSTFAELDRQRTLISNGSLLYEAAGLRDVDRRRLGDLEAAAIEALDEIGWEPDEDTRLEPVGVARPPAKGEGDAFVYFKTTYPGPWSGTECVALIALTRDGERRQAYEITGAVAAPPRR